MICPGCGAPPNAGCVIDLREMPGCGEWAPGATSLLCVGHERPYWLVEVDAPHEDDDDRTVPSSDTESEAA